MPRLIRGVARTAVVAGTAAGVAGRVQHRQQQRWSQQEYDQAQVAAPATAAAGEDTMAQLKELGELHASGVLTDEEFAAQKAKLLGS
jgi:membrane protease subunit (stomatin/prohibitin family)